MTLRCDHCRQPLGAMVRRYWHMRFCSDACRQAYQRRLHDDTKQKIARIRDAEYGRPGAPRLAKRLFGPQSRADSARPLAS
jgi:hypothetical protein